MTSTAPDGGRESCCPAEHAAHASTVTDTVACGARCRRTKQFPSSVPTSHRDPVNTIQPKLGSISSDHQPERSVSCRRRTVAAQVGSGRARLDSARGPTVAVALRSGLASIQTAMARQCQGEASIAAVIWSRGWDDAAASPHEKDAGRRTYQPRGEFEFRPPLHRVRDSGLLGLQTR